MWNLKPARMPETRPFKIYNMNSSCQFISWTFFVNSGKYMDNCWTIIWHFMAQTTQISVDLIKKNLYFRDGFGLRMNMYEQEYSVDIALIFSPINRRLTSWSSPIAVNFLIWRWMFLNFMILFYFRVIRAVFIF